MLKNYNQLSFQDKQDIIKAYYDGVDFQEIHKTLYVSERSVSRVLKEEGINTRRKNRYKLNENFFENIITQEQSYILGLIYADGYVGVGKENNVVISLMETDAGLLEKVASNMEFTGKIRLSERGSGFNTEYKAAILNFSSEKMCNDLSKLGLTSNKSTTMLEIPKLSDELMRHFIRGYFDGDGCVCISQNSRNYTMADGSLKVYRYPCPHANIIGTVPFLQKIEAYIPAICHYKNSNTEQMKYLCCYGKKNLPELYEYLYDGATIYLERKFNKWQEVLGVING